MSKLDLDAIEARAEAATEGPWFVTEDDPVAEPWLIDESMSDLEKRLAHRLLVGQGDEPEDGRCVTEISWSNGLDHADFRNSQFIAHARTDIPALVAEVRRLKEFEPSYCECGARKAQIYPQCEGCYTED